MTQQDYKQYLPKGMYLFYELHIFKVTHHFGFSNQHICFSLVNGAFLPICGKSLQIPTTVCSKCHKRPLIGFPVSFSLKCVRVNKKMKNIEREREKSSQTLVFSVLVLATQTFMKENSFDTCMYVHSFTFFNYSSA